jgi:hypothetical protein
MEYIKKLRHSFTEPNTVDRVVTAGGERRELATIWPRLGHTTLEDLSVIAGV